MAEDIHTVKPEQDTSMGNGDIQAAREDASIIEIPHTNSHIGFVIGDQQWKLGDEQRLVRYCDWMVHIYQMKHPTVRSHICSNYGYRQKLYLKLCPPQKLQFNQ